MALERCDVENKSEVNHQVFVRCGRQLRIAELSVRRGGCHSESHDAGTSSVVIGQFSLDGVDTEFVREVIAYSVCDRGVLSDTITLQQNGRFQPRVIHWRIPATADLHEKLGW